MFPITWWPSPTRLSAACAARPGRTPI
jgi:hypothetical protein